ncbi:MAG TPA: hypothetical protein VKS78_16435 [Roseiarcus sp.]|nr:hypothetical protein [Roseiarcus sp.]
MVRRVVTDNLLRYLDAKQHLWNSYFLGQVADLREREPLESFELIDRRLLFALVCRPLKLALPPDHYFFADPIRDILAIPRSYVTELNMMMSKPSEDGNRYWERPTLFPKEGLVLSFIEFFQWDRYGFQSASLARCKVEAIASHPEYEGREALVEFREYEFVLAAKNTGKSPSKTRER